MENGESVDALAEAFRAAGGRVREAHAEVIRKRETELLAASASRHAAEQLEQAMAALQIAEERLKAAPPVLAPSADDLQRGAGREIHHAVLATKPGAIVRVSRAGRVIDEAPQAGDPATYWRKAAPKPFRLLSLFGRKATP